MLTLKNQANPRPTNGAFPTTHWTVINALKQPNLEDREALYVEFFEKYTPAFRMQLIHGRGYRHEADIEDTIQGFLADKFVFKNILEYVNEGNGRLRDYLRRCLDHYVYEQHRSKSAAAWDNRVAWDELGIDPTELCQPQQTCPFDVGWAKTVLCESIGRTKKQFIDSPRQHVWSVFDCCILRPLLTGMPATPYDELAQSTGLTIKAVQNRRVTAMRAFGKHLTAVIAEYIGNDPSRIDSEVNDLKRIMCSDFFRDSIAGGLLSEIE